MQHFWENFPMLVAGVSTIIGAIAAAAVLVIKALKGVHKEVQQLDIKVDGRLTELLAETKSAAHATGVKEGIETNLERRKQK